MSGYGLANMDLNNMLKNRASTNDAIGGYHNYLAENQINPEFYNQLSGAERGALAQGYGNLNPNIGSEISFGNISSVGDFGKWLGQGNNLQTGLAALGAAGQLYGAYNQSKYQKKMGDLAERQQNIYEQEVKRQQQRQDRAQAAYDKAQGM